MYKSSKKIPGFPTQGTLEAQALFITNYVSRGNTVTVDHGKFKVEISKGSRATDQGFYKSILESFSNVCAAMELIKSGQKPILEASITEREWTKAYEQVNSTREAQEFAIGWACNRENANTIFSGIDVLGAAEYPEQHLDIWFKYM